MRTNVDRRRAAGSVGAFVLLVVGLPMLLVRAARARFGGPLPWYGIRPRDWSWSRAADGLTSRLTDETVIDVVLRATLAIAWAATAVVFVTVLAEVAHIRRHGGLPRPHVRGLGWSQRCARSIAAGLVVLLPATAVGRASARTTLDAMRAPAGVVATLPAPPERPSERVEPTDHYVVASGDSIYGIAERLAAGDTSQVEEIAGSLLELNLGRTMPDGQRFLTAAYIEPGWTLVLPGDARLTTASPAEGTGDQYVVEVGDTLTSIANDELGDPARWDDIWLENRGHAMVDGRTFDDRNLILPGWHLELPDLLVAETVGASPAPTAMTPSTVVATVTEPTAPAATSVTTATTVTTPPAATASTTVTTPPAATTVTAVTTPPAATTPRVAAPDSASAAPTGPALAVHGTPTGSRSPVGLEHAAMLASGLLALVAARRRRRLRAAMPPARVPMPSTSSAALERSLRVVDAGERFMRLDLAVRAAAEPVADAGRRLSAAAVDVTGEVAVWLDGDVSLPAPWRGSGHMWTLPATVPVDELAAAARRGGCPCIALVQLGVTDDGADVYVDLEAVGIMAVEGAPDVADDIVTAVAVTLASSPLAEVAHLIDVGLPSAAFLGHRHHCRSDTVRDAIASGLALVSPRRDASAFELRVRGTGGEMWEPAVVLVASAHVADVDAAAVDAARAHSMALVVAGTVDAPCARLVPDADCWVLQPLGIELTPVGVTRREVAEVAQLVDDADRAVEHGGVMFPEPGNERAAHGSTAHDWTLMVRVLGPVDVVDVRGTAASFEKSKARELMAWLAFHAERPTRSGARTAMWELDVRDATFANVVSEARRATARLVEPPEEDAWIRRTLTDDLPLHPGVVTDAQLLAHDLRAARTLPIDDAVVTLERAVELVRGIPFEGTSYLWPDAEGITSDLVLHATSAAVELARLHLERGDVEGVFRATGRGLRVLPGHEELIALRMRAHARRGDLAGVRHEWESYERVIHADPWSDGEPAPKLLQLRQELLARSA